MEIIRAPKSKELITPRVLNKHKDIDEIRTYRDDQIVYIGRGSDWGNPFKIGPDGNRDEVILKYSEYLMTRPDLLDRISELEGKHLICYCAPEPCHGDILLSLANIKPPKEEKSKKVKRVVTRVKAVDIESEEKQVISRVKAEPVEDTIKVRVDIHSKTDRRNCPERVVEVQREDEESALELAINKRGNWSKYDDLWHMGMPSYNKETYQQSRDRVRLYYEWKYSYPSDEDWMKIKSNAMSGFFAGFVAGRAYAQEHITPEQIEEWKKKRAKRIQLNTQDPGYDDIPF